MGASKVTSTRAVYLAGLVGGSVHQLPLICVRKNCIRSKEIPEAKLITKKRQEVIGIVSHPGLCKSKTAPYVQAWCHCFRNPDEHIDPAKPKVLLSESDFVDSMYIRMAGKRSPKYDFFYFTQGTEKCSRRKGVDLFMRMLPSLAARKMKIAVVNYNHKPLHFTEKQRITWKRLDHHIDYIDRKLEPEGVAELMAASRFGLFPNGADCSPLLLAEALVRNRPVFVNADIWGGWKYVNDQTGVFFSADSLETSLDALLSKQFNPADNFMSEYGFRKTAKRLADFGREHFRAFADCDYACFEGLSRLLSEV